jgi:carboxyl-terminal processing protease
MNDTPSSRLLLCLVPILLLLACGSPTAPPTATSQPAALPTSTPTMSAEARAYLDQALDLVQQHALNRDQLDWPRVRQAAYDRAAKALTPADTYPAIKGALSCLRDGYHSRLFTPDEVAAMESGALDGANVDPSGELLDSGLAYLLLPGVGGSAELCQGYATAVQRLLGGLDAAEPCGWIVDLRQNNGGNMWPMLAGVGPLLGEGQAGSFVYPDGRHDPWSYAEGQASCGDAVVIAIDSSLALAPLEPLPPVAVLTDRVTASSGEAIVVAFRGRPDTRSFGTETAGWSTANQGFPLADGAVLNLTIARYADRTGTVYDGPITPDEVVNASEGPSVQVLEAAVTWLLSQPTCAGSGR